MEGVAETLYAIRSAAKSLRPQQVRKSLEAVRTEAVNVVSRCEECVVLTCPTGGCNTIIDTNHVRNVFDGYNAQLKICRNFHACNFYLRWVSASLRRRYIRYRPIYKHQFLAVLPMLLFISHDIFGINLKYARNDAITIQCDARWSQHNSEGKWVIFQIVYSCCNLKPSAMLPIHRLIRYLGNIVASCFLQTPMHSY